jgi:hypothetical protein
MTTTPPTFYQLDLETLGYAIGQLLRRTSIRSSRSLRDTTINFINDTGINFQAMGDHDKEVLFRNVGRGYATKREKERKTHERVL